MFFSHMIHVWFFGAIGAPPSHEGIPPTKWNLEELKRRALSGRAVEVDFLMAQLHLEQEFGRLKMVDHALGLVDTAAGRERIRHWLFFGERRIQRNYAALYFKRRGETAVLDEAVRRGAIDEVQAYSS